MHRCRALRAASLVVASVFLLPVARVESASASFPGSNGRIVYEQVHDYNSFPDQNIRTVASSGGEVTRLPLYGFDPQWSPEGTRIAYSLDHSIYVANADGSNSRRAGTGYSPTWAPNGSRIAFVRSVGDASVNDTDIFVMRAGGADVQRLTNTRGPDKSSSLPAWSKSGIAFVRDLPDDESGVFRMNSDGSGVARKITVGWKRIVTDLDWSSNGSKLLVTLFDIDCPDSGEFRIIEVLSGPSRTRTVTACAQFAGAVYAPEGGRIAVGRHVIGESRGIYILDLDGRVMQRLTRDRGRDPSWQALPS